MDTTNSSAAIPRTAPPCDVPLSDSLDCVTTQLPKNESKTAITRIAKPHTRRTKPGRSSGSLIPGGTFEAWAHPIGGLGGSSDSTPFTFFASAERLSGLGRSTTNRGCPRAPEGGHTWCVTPPQYEATLRAVASLDFAVEMLMNAEHPEPRAPGWTPEFTSQLATGMQSCRWFLATGFTPPERFGSWLRGCLAEKDLGHSDICGSIAWRAADGVDRLSQEWRPEWSM
jgi:hypothetical protein